MHSMQEPWALACPLIVSFYDFLPFTTESAVCQMEGLGEHISLVLPTLVRCASLT